VKSSGMIPEDEDFELDPFSMEMDINPDASDAQITVGAMKKQGIRGEDIDYTKTLSNGRMIRESVEAARASGRVPLGKCMGCLEMIPLPPEDGITDDLSIVDIGTQNTLDGHKGDPEDGDMVMCPLCGHLSELKDGTTVELDMDKLKRFSVKHPKQYEVMLRHQKIIRMRKD
jgi:hypothetical protein